MLSPIHQSLVQQKLTWLRKLVDQQKCYTARCFFQLIIFPSPCPAENKPFAILPHDHNVKAIRAEVDFILQYTQMHRVRSINKATTALHHT